GRLLRIFPSLRGKLVRDVECDHPLFRQIDDRLQRNERDLLVPRRTPLLRFGHPLERLAGAGRTWGERVDRFRASRVHRDLLRERSFRGYRVVDRPQRGESIVDLGRRLLLGVQRDLRLPGRCGGRLQLQSSDGHHPRCRLPGGGHGYILFGPELPSPTGLLRNVWRALGLDLGRRRNTRRRFGGRRPARTTGTTGGAHPPAHSHPSKRSNPRAGGTSTGVRGVDLCCAMESTEVAHLVETSTSGRGYDPGGPLSGKCPIRPILLSGRSSRRQVYRGARRRRAQRGLTRPYGFHPTAAGRAFGLPVSPSPASPAGPRPPRDGQDHLRPRTPTVVPRQTGLCLRPARTYRAREGLPVACGTHLRRQ